MKTTPFTMALIYGLMGALFTYLAIKSVQDTIWNFYTILLMIIATFDFTTALRFLFYKKFIEKQK
ncbi:YdiK family protein [Calidifontibacillus erzurumensis]|uniref:YdiK family protein n=1 Tax=Calidifontibacillus erzurumensis TaxID=2741433 RepID=A0A8J8GGC0_9BACI|nr:YdiK family protein [Calidifontibacillus erzurumensis]NSL53132.1 YdiK family protein [Calidifontibacillus erzurumensis]